MDDPDVVVRVDPDADRGAEHPVIGERLRPERVDFESRRQDGAAALGVGRVLEHGLADSERRQERRQTHPNQHGARAHSMSHSCLPAGGRVARADGGRKSDPASRRTSINHLRNE